jgi:DNA-binding transcriptional LysR family regulator
MDDVEVRELRTFLAAIDHGSFSAAARALGTTQPTVSRTVARLEEVVGARLVERTTRALTLTASGTALADQARRALDQVSAAVALARRAAHEPGRLVVAVKPDGDAGLLDAAVATFEAPDRTVSLILGETETLADAVRTGRADACLVAGPVDLADLDTDLVLSEPRYAVLPPDHPLTGRERLRRADLADVPMLTWPAVSPALDRYYQGLLPDEPARRTPGPSAATLADAIRLVELGRGVTLLPASVCARFAERRIAVVPVEDLAPSDLRVAWRPSSRDLTLAAFVRHVHASAADR